MTLRKLTVAAVATIALTSSAFAADQATSTSNWGVGTMFYFSGNANASPGLVATYLNDQFIVQGGVAYENEQKNGGRTSTNTHNYATTLGFGLRNMMNNQVSLDYGIGGSYGFVNNKSQNENNPYSVGVFVGVDFMPVQNVLFTAGISPYTYAKDSDQDKYTSIFSTGSISVSYMF